MGDNIKEEVEKTTRTLKERNTLILNKKGELSLVFLKLKDNDVEDYWLDFEDSEDISEDEKVLFKIPIVYPQNVTQDKNSFDNPLGNNLENITIFENNKFYIDQLNDCLYNSSNSEINDIQVSAQMYIKLPEFFTIRIEIKKKTRRIFLGFVTLEDNHWGIDIILTNNNRLHNPNAERSELLQKIIYEDHPIIEGVRLQEFKRGELLNYTFEQAQGKLLNDIVNSDKSLQEKMNNLRSPPSTMKSIRSPAGKAMEDDNPYVLPIATSLFDIERHSVDGLKSIASDPSRFVPSRAGFRTISNLDKDKKELLTINKQIINNNQKKIFIQNQTSCRRMVNDTVDRAHDFIYVNPGTITINAKETGCISSLEQLNLLSTESSNINVPNSHSIQENNITDLHSNLKNQDIIVPSLPKDIFVSRRFVFADFVDFLFKADKLTETEKKAHLSKRNHYAESGKQVTLKTLRVYLTELNNNPEERDLFLLDIQRLTNSNDNNIDRIIELTASIQSLVNGNENYPIISKNCYQQMDGCSTGPSHFDSSLSKARIDGIFGLYDIHLENKSCNQNQQVNTITVSKDDDIVYIINVVGEITLDKVVRSILVIDDNNEKYKFRGVNSGEGSIFNPLPSTPDKDENILILMALKTFCDKLYRLSMKNENKKLTHIFTIDSYVYGDPYLQYLLAKETYCPAVLRSAQGIVHDVEKVENKEVRINNLCKQDGKIKGFWYRPSIGIEDSEKGYLEKLYHRFANYFLILMNSINILRDNYSNISGYIYTDHGDILLNRDDNTIKIQSHRVNNYFERIAYFFTNYTNLSELDLENLDYNQVMGHLTYLEICKVFQGVKTYYNNGSEIFNIIQLGDNINTENLDKIRKFLIQVPDLENLLQLSSPTIFVENQEIGVNIEQNDDLRILYANDKKECRDIFGIHVEEDEEKVNSESPVFNFINYDEETDKIQYTITKNNNTPQTKYNSFTLEFAINLYNNMSSLDVGEKVNNKLEELKDIIIQKIDTLKDLIGITDEECKNIQYYIDSKKEGENNMKQSGDIFNVKKADDPDDPDDQGPNDKQLSKRTAAERSPQNQNQNKSAKQSGQSRPSFNAGAGDLNFSFPAGVGMSAETSEPYNQGDDVYNPLIPGSGADTSPIRGNNNPSPGRVSRDRRRASAPREETNDKNQGQNIFGTGYKDQPGGTKLKRKQTRRVKKKLRNTINKISKMTHKNKTKRRCKNRRKTRKS